jgi:hypothetical protein
MKNVDTPELWDMGDEEVDEPADSVGDAESALPLDVLASRGSAAATVRRRFPGLVSEIQRSARPCTSIEDIYGRGARGARPDAGRGRADGELLPRGARHKSSNLDAFRLICRSVQGLLKMNRITGYERSRSRFVGAKARTYS